MAKKKKAVKKVKLKSVPKEIVKKKAGALKSKQVPAQKIIAKKLERVLSGKKGQPGGREEKRKPLKAIVFDEEKEKDLFEEKVGENTFEKKGLADKEEEPQPEVDDDEDEDDDSGDEDDDDKNKEKWNAPRPGRFDGDDEDF